LNLRDDSLPARPNSLTFFWFGSLVDRACALRSVIRHFVSGVGNVPGLLR